MAFSSEHVAFGRHETFPLRFSWLPKGIHALERDPKAFESEESTVKLGVGRNMVNAIRYWLRASRMVEAGSYQFTDLGRELLSNDGYDPYLEDEATIWLLHWLVASNGELATSFFWFFNRFQQREFGSEELQTALSDFLIDQIPKEKRPAKNTIKSDATVILRMYAQSKIVQRGPLEEALDSPFALLKLVEHKSNDRTFVSRMDERAGLPLEILGFAVLEVYRANGSVILPIEDLMYCRHNLAAPGSVFRLTESEFIRKLELLTQAFPQVFDIRESSGIHQLFILDESIRPSEMISHYYKSSGARAVA